jgi:hypothetical protein
MKQKEVKVDLVAMIDALSDKDLKRLQCLIEIKLIERDYVQWEKNVGLNWVEQIYGKKGAAYE